jgi:DNA repair protein RecO (recombination protein O)
MGKAYNARCLVIKHTKLGEIDSIVTLLAEDGHQIRAVAKGLRKPGNKIGARLELFAEVDLLLREGKSLDIVSEVHTVCTNAVLREGLERPASASVVAELLEKMGRDGAVLGDRTYAMSVVALNAMGTCAQEAAAFLAAAHLFKAMGMQGLAPATRECALCGELVETPKAFDVSYGGVVCDDCRERSGIETSTHPEIIAWIDALLYRTFAELSTIESPPTLVLLDLAQTWISEHMSLNLKSMAFLKGLLV